MSVQQLVAEFLAEQVTAVSDQSILKNAEVHNSPFEEIEKEKGVRLGYTTADLGPEPGNDGVKKANVVTAIICYWAAARDKEDRAEARENLDTFADAVTMLFFENQDMGGRVETARIFASRDGFDTVDGTRYAVVHLGLVINETGELSQSELERRAFR